MRAAALLVGRVNVESTFLFPVVIVEALLLNLVIVVHVMAIGLNVFPQGGRIGVPLRATWHFAAIGLVHGMCSGMLESV